MNKKLTSSTSYENSFVNFQQFLDNVPKSYSVDCWDEYFKEGNFFVVDKNWHEFNPEIQSSVRHIHVETPQISRGWKSKRVNDIFLMKIVLWQLKKKLFAHCDTQTHNGYIQILLVRENL